MANNETLVEDQNSVQENNQAQQEPDFFVGLQSLVDNNSSDDEVLRYASDWDSQYGTNYASELQGSNQTEEVQQEDSYGSTGDNEFFDKLDELVSNNATESEIETYAMNYDDSNGTAYYEELTGQSLGEEDKANRKAKHKRDILEQTLVGFDVPDVVSEPLFAFGQGILNIAGGVVDFGAQQAARFDEDLQKQLEEATPEDRNEIWDKYNEAADGIREAADYIGETQGSYGSGSIITEFSEGNYYNAANLTVNQTAQGVASLLPFLIPYVGTVAGPALLGTSAAGGAFEEDIESKNASMDQIYNASYLKGGVELVTEFVTAGIVGRAKAFAGGGASRRAVNDYTRAAWKSVAGDTLSEAASEGLADTGTRIVDSAVYGDDINTKDALVGFIDSAIIGGIIGGKVSTFGQIAKPGVGKALAAQTLRTDAQKEADHNSINKIESLTAGIESIQTKSEGLSKIDEIAIESMEAERDSEIQDLTERRAGHEENLETFTPTELKDYADSLDKSNNLKAEKAKIESKNELDPNSDPDAFIQDLSLINEVIAKEDAKVNDVYSRVNNWDNTSDQANAIQDNIDEKREDIRVKEEALKSAEKPNPVTTRKLNKQKADLDSKEKGLSDAMEATRSGVKWRNNKPSTVGGADLGSILNAVEVDQTDSDGNTSKGVEVQIDPNNLHKTLSDNYDSIPEEFKADDFLGGVLSDSEFTASDIENFLIDNNARISKNAGRRLYSDKGADASLQVDIAKVIDSIEPGSDKITGFLSDDVKASRLPKIIEGIKKYQSDLSGNSNSDALIDSLSKEATYDELNDIKRRLGRNVSKGNTSYSFKKAFDAIVEPRLRESAPNSETGLKSLDEMTSMLNEAYRKASGSKGYKRAALAVPSGGLANMVADNMSRNFYKNKKERTDVDGGALIPMQSAFNGVGKRIALEAGYVDADGNVTDAGKELYLSESRKEHSNDIMRTVIQAKLGASVFDVLSDYGKVGKHTSFEDLPRSKHFKKADGTRITKKAAPFVKVLDAPFISGLIAESSYSKDRPSNKKIIDGSTELLNNLPNNITPRELNKLLGYNLFTRMNEDLMDEPIPQELLNTAKAIANTELSVNNKMLDFILNNKDSNLVGFAEDLESGDSDLISRSAPKKAMNDAVIGDAVEGRDLNSIKLLPLLYWGGRKGYQSSFLTPKGNDLSKSLLQAKESSVMGKDGYSAAIVQLADTFGYKDVDGDKKPVSIEEREAFVDDRIEEWIEKLNSGDNFWEKAKEPMLFVSTLQEVSAARDSGDVDTYESKIFLHADASTQQLQIVAGLTGDKTLAYISNLTNSPAEGVDVKGQQRDAYDFISKGAFQNIVDNSHRSDEDVLKRVGSKLVKLEQEVSSAKGFKQLDKAKRALREYKKENKQEIETAYYTLFNLPGMISTKRDLSKPPVLQAGYGSGDLAAGKSLSKEKFDSRSKEGAQYMGTTMSTMLSENILSSYEGQLPTMSRLKEVLRKISNDVANVEAKKDWNERKEEAEALGRKFNEPYPEGRQVEWTLPVDKLKVKQSYQNTTSTSVGVEFDNTKSNLDFVSDNHGVKAHKSGTAIFANFILSMDSQIPASIYNKEGRAYPFIDVFDSFATTPGHFIEMKGDIVDAYKIVANPKNLLKAFEDMLGNRDKAREYFDLVYVGDFDIDSELSRDDFPFAMLQAGAHRTDVKTVDKGVSPDSIDSGSITEGDTLDSIEQFLEGDRKAKPRNAKEMTPLLDKLSKAFPDSNIVVGKQDMIDRLTKSNQNKAAEDVRNNVIKGFIDPKSGDVYLNEETLSYETPIHEFGHLWSKITKSERPALYNKGINLLKDSKIYHDVFEKANDKDSVYHGLSKEQLEEEVMSTAIGKYGDRIFNVASNQNKWNTWVDSVFNWVGKKTGLKIPLRDITLGEFMDVAVAEILTGKSLVDSKDIETAKNSELSKAMANNDPESKTNIPNKKLSKFLDDSIRSKLKKGLKPYKKSSPFRYSKIDGDTALKLKATLAHFDKVSDTLNIETKKSLLANINEIIKTGKSNRKDQKAVFESRKAETRNVVDSAIKESSGIEVDNLTKTQANKLAKDKDSWVNKILGKNALANALSPGSNNDFYGLLYDLLPTGKSRESFRSKIDETLIKPLEKSNLDYLEAKKQMRQNWVDAKVMAITGKKSNDLSSKQLNKALKDSNDLLNEKSSVKYAGSNLRNYDIVKIYNYMKDPSTYRSIEKSKISDSMLDSVVEYVHSNKKLKSYADALPSVYAGIVPAINAKLDSHGRETFSKTRIDPTKLSKEEISRLEKINGGSLPLFSTYTPLTSDGADVDADVDKLIANDQYTMYTVMDGRLKNRTGAGELILHGNNLDGDFNSYMDGPVRTMSFLDFAKNASDFFGPKQMTAMRAAYGDQWSSAMKDSLRRIVTGKNQTGKQNEATKVLDKWINRTVGTVMTLNTRSAILQLLSTSNFMVSDPTAVFSGIGASKADKQLVKSFLKGSEWVKERGKGKVDLAVDAIFNDDQPGFVDKVLQKGYVLTKLGDKFAITTGGAPYMTGKYLKYKNEGLSQDEALKSAYADFVSQAEETQQSTRPERLGHTQTTQTGKLILAFANTPMQYNRKMSKAIKDLRAEGTSKERKAQAGRELLYYGALQNVVFTSLQKLMLPGVSAELEDEKSLDFANSLANTILRGIGVWGAVLASLKDAAIAASRDKDIYSPLVNTSPAIGTKIRHLRTALGAKKIYAQSEYVDDPLVYQVASGANALFNIPLDRGVKIVEQGADAFSSDFEWYQGVLRALGWSRYDLGESVSSSPLNRLEEGTTGQIFNDGSIEVDPNLTPIEREKTIAHEMKHKEQMEENGLGYDDHSISWNGSKYERKAGKINYNGSWYPEGHPELPWEAEAFAAENKVEIPREKGSAMKRLKELYA